MFLKVNSKKDVLIHLGVITGITLVLIFLFFSVYLPITTHHGEAIKVPDLKGKTLAQLDELLSGYSLRYQVNDSNYVAGATPFSVISQHPLPGSEVKANRTIYIAVTAQNPPMVAMPELRDKSVRTAEMELKSRDLILAETRPVPDQFVDRVVKQYLRNTEVLPGTLVPKGSKITLDVGNGMTAPETETELNTDSEGIDHP